MDALAEDLRGLDPPLDIAEGHEGLVELIESFADLSRDFSSQLRNGDAKALAAYRYAGSPRAAPPGPYPLRKYITPSPEVISKAQLFALQAERGDYDIEGVASVPAIGP